MDTLQQAQQLEKRTQEAAEVAKQKAELNQQKYSLMDRRNDRLNTAESVLSTISGR
ncbi:hypothetical protein LWE69_09405 [Paenibacillus sp. UKAQ_18]|nr:hypothetical protein [Paenibacillus sp. UKAQ_18]